jgi:hypothetical protein
MTASMAVDERDDGYLLGLGDIRAAVINIACPPFAGYAELANYPFVLLPRT